MRLTAERAAEQGLAALCRGLSWATVEVVIHLNHARTFHIGSSAISTQRVRFAVPLQISETAKLRLRGKFWSSHSFINR